MSDLGHAVRDVFAALGVPVAADVRRADVPATTVEPWEEPLLGRPGGDRRLQSVTAHRCATTAAAELLPTGAEASAAHVGRRPDGTPDWPPGLVGSITHCDGVRAAVAARADDADALGLDAEPHRPLPRGVLSLTRAPGDTGLTGTAATGQCADTVLFCVKESAYKAWFPVTRRWVPAVRAQAHLTPHGADGGRFTVAVPDRSRAEPAVLRGGWVVRSGVVLAGCVPGGPA